MSNFILLPAEPHTAQERSALARHAAWSRWHHAAQEVTYLITQALKGKQLPLV